MGAASARRGRLKHPRIDVYALQTRRMADADTSSSFNQTLNPFHAEHLRHGALGACALDSEREDKHY